MPEIDLFVIFGKKILKIKDKNTKKRKEKLATKHSKSAHGSLTKKTISPNDRYNNSDINSPVNNHHPNYHQNNQSYLGLFASNLINSALIAQTPGPGSNDNLPLSVGNNIHNTSNNGISK